MNTINHALWGATIGRVVGLPVEGAVITALPDIISVPLFGLTKYGYGVKLSQSPKWIFRIYYFTHNWFTALVVVIILYNLSPRFGLLGLGYLWHVVEDAFSHTDLATPFLWPLWKGRIQKYSAAEHWWIQIVELFLIGGVNLFLSITHGHA